MSNVPMAPIGSIGGSGTWGARFPEDLGRSEVALVQVYKEGFATPFGKSAPFKLLEIRGKNVLRTAMHGWHLDENGHQIPTWTCANQVAWVFREAGIEWAIVDGSVGGIRNPDNTLEAIGPWSVVITDDYIQTWLPPSLSPGYDPDTPYPRQRDPFCAAIRQVLYGHAVNEKRFTVYDHGVYACTRIDRLETAAEIRMLAMWGAHIVGQTLGHEAPLMRQLGIHLGSLNIVSNYAEGHSAWTGNESNAWAQFYRDCAIPVGNVLVSALAELAENGLGVCHCRDHVSTGLDEFPVPGA